MKSSPPEEPKDPESANGSDSELEARLEAAESLRLEAKRDGVKDIEREAKIDELEWLTPAESLRLEAKRDGLKDTAREAKIEKLESAGDLVEKSTDPIGAFRGERKPPDRKINPARMEKGWYVKPERTQRRILQKKTGSYRPEPDDPISQKSLGKGVAEGSLFDPHPLSKVRKRDAEATGTIRAAIAAPLPVKPVNPGPAEEPIPGRCWECYKPLRKRDRAGTKFCTDNMGDCRNAYNAREADRAERNRIFKEWSDSRHTERMLSVHCRAADAMRESAARCGIKDVTFTAMADGVMAVHTKPLPPIEPQFNSSVVPCIIMADGTMLHPKTQISVRLEVDNGSTRHDVEIVATATDTGTLYTFEMKARPEGNATDITLGFKGDPGPEWTGEAFPTPVPPLPPGAAMYAARNGRTAEYIAALKRDLAA